MPSDTAQHPIEPSSGSPAIDTATPLKRWFLRRIERHLPTIHGNSLLMTYVASIYGELYEYLTQFTEVVNLIALSDEPQRIRRQVNRFGWYWYEIDGKSTDVHRIDVVGGRSGKSVRLSASMAPRVPGYLYRAYFPTVGEEYLTVDDFPRVIAQENPEETLCQVCALIGNPGPINSLFMRAEEVFHDTKLLETDIDQRRKIRSLNLNAVNTDSQVTSVRIRATKDMLTFLAESLVHA